MMFSALTARLWYLQVLATERFAEDANNSSLRLIEMPAARGRIFDARNRVLVDNRQSLEITVEQQELGDDPEGVILRLSEHLGVPAADIAARLQDPQYYDYQPIPVAVDVSQQDIFYIAEHGKEFPGVGWTQASVREYPLGALSAHILGTVGLINAQEIAAPAFQGFGPNDTVGKTGLEKTYERFLRGTPGTDKVVVNPAGKLLNQLGGVKPIPGSDLKLYLDSRLQAKVEQGLADGLDRARGIFDTATNRDLVANAGAVVVMDPSTFGVEAVASWPTFDPTWFVEGMTNKEAKQRITGPGAGSPLFDRAVQAAYAPGSTFKPFVALAAVNDGITSLGSYTPCPPAFSYRLDPNTVFHNWSSYDQGSLSIPLALKVSCDTVFYRWGSEFYDRWRANPLGTNSEPLQHDLRGFGFGKAPGIDLPSQGSGFIPTAAWKEQQHQDDPKAFPYGWLPGDDILMSIGQGYVTTSPMQMAVAYSSLANGGKLCQPRIVQQIQDVDGNRVHRAPDQHCHKLPFSSQEISVIRSGLAQVVQPGGTAGFAFAGFPLGRVPVAGKTGTAERPGFDVGQDTSWFAAIVGPPGGDQHVIVAMVEQGGHGSTTAAPIVRSIIEQMYGIQTSGGTSTVGTD